MIEKRFEIKSEWLFFPVWNVAGEEPEKETLEIFCEEPGGRKKLFEFQVLAKVPGAEENCPIRYYARFPVKQFTDKTLILRGELPEAFFDAVTTNDIVVAALQQSSAAAGVSVRPSIHFTPETGWMNDPNGLVYADGYYHLYFQHNPFDIRWENMSWGHARSRDLLHWEQKADVLFPDGNGTMFSGSGIINEKELLGLPPEALLFFYTAAGDTIPWNRGKEASQHVAYSLDGGMTLHKTEKGTLDTVEHENRDPKVFWHEESGAYIMVLWLDKNDFGIFRSTNLEYWTQSDRITLDQAWECPDLMCLTDENGRKHWMFFSADGFYFWGTFDGYQFKTDGIRHEAYINRIPYAAQTYSGVYGRTISIPWLRMPNRGRNYTGAMGLPREFRVCEIDGEKLLCQMPVREYERAKRSIEFIKKDAADEICYQKDGSGAVELQVQRKKEQRQIAWKINGMAISYDADAGRFCVGEEEFSIRKNVSDFSFLLDDVILEVTAGYGTIIGVFELPGNGVELLTRRSYFEKMQLFLEELWRP